MMILSGTVTIIAVTGFNFCFDFNAWRIMPDERLLDQAQAGKVGMRIYTGSMSSDLEDEDMYFSNWREVFAYLRDLRKLGADVEFIKDSVAL